MRRMLIACCVLGLTLALPAALSSAHAAGKEGEKHTPVYKYKAKKKEAEADLRKDKEKETLLELLLLGEVEHLERKHETNLISQAADQAIWTLLVFGALLFILWKYAWAPIRDGLHRREESIAQAFEEARLARAETETLRQELAAEKARANEEARQIRDDARRAADRMAADARAKGMADVQAEHDRKKRELAQMEAQAKQQMVIQTADLATLISAKVIHRQLNPDDHRQLLDEALAEFRQSAQARKHEYDSVHA
jgi:F-type H+-transporting ATPase subunit b